MNHATRFMRLALALVLVGALVLAGCGGDDNSGVEQDLRDQIAMLEGDLSSAQTAQAAAEAAQMAAEEAQMEAEAAQAEAEMERDAANTAKGAAEAAQMAAEEAEDMAMQAQMDAEAAQATAEQAAMDAAAAQTAAEQAQAVAEANAKTASDALAAAKADAVEAMEAAAAAREAQAEAVTAANAARDSAIEDKAAAEKAAMDAQTAADAMVADYKMKAEAAAAAQKMAEDAKAMADMAKMEAETAAADAMKAQETAEMERDDANTAKMAADDAAKMAADAQAAAEADRDKYKKMAEDAEAAKMTAQEAAATARNAQTEAERRLAIAEGRISAESAAEVAARAKRLAAAMDGIIMDGKDNTVDPDDEFDGLAADPVTPAQPKDDVYPGQIKEVESAPMATTGLTFSHTEATGVKITSVNNEPPEFQQYRMVDSMAPAISGWESVTLQRRNDPDAATQTVYAYTDIATATVETFLEKYGKDLQAGKLMVNMENLEDAMSATFPTRTEESTDIPATAPAFAGAFDGVPGEFECTSTGPCDITADSTTGALSIATDGEFTFTPDDIDTVITKADGDYLYFGYWLHKPDTPGNEHRFSLIAGGSDPFDTDGDGTTGSLAAVTGLAGQARYSGSAAGKYVTRGVDADTAKIGQFTATANLIARFGTSAEAGDVGGVVRDFMEGGESLGSNWRVTLDPAMLDQIGMAEHTDAGGADDPMGKLRGRTEGGYSRTQFTGTTTATVGASTVTGGRWVGTFHGNDRRDGKPEAIAGMFEVNAEHVAISGAFGVKNTGP